MDKHKVRPIYIKVLIIMIVLYIANMTFIMADLYYKVGNIEHVLVHIDKGYSCPHK